MSSRISNWRTFLRDVRGTAAVEFVLWFPVIAMPLVGVIDLGIFAVQRMQVEAASQAGAAAAWRVCDKDAEHPVTNANCASVGSTITAAVQGTGLGAGATVASTPVVGYYCATDAGALTSVSSTWPIDSTTPPAKPADCSAAVGGSTTKPGEYIQVTVNFTYTPMFGVLRTAGVLPSTIGHTAWRRVS
jgi:Flp pilus assembly protein TadG